MILDDKSTKNIGLRGITVADTRISLVDGERGRLIYRGYRIEELARSASFEEVLYLLLNCRLPVAQELEETVRFLAEARHLPEPVVALLWTRAPEADPMSVLQSAVAALPDHDPDFGVMERGALVRSAMRLVARTAMVVTTWHHLREGREPPALSDGDSHAAAILRALTGEEPSKEKTALVDTLLVLHAEHTLNASTFAVREVASTRADLYASVTAGVGALSGALHGGANARAMEMLRTIGSEEQIEDWVKARIEAGERIMGLGHAVYRVEDPRAAVLKAVAQETLTGTEEERWFRMALKLESVARPLLLEKKGRDLAPNVDFYSGGVLRALGLSVDFFPAFFAVSRVAGWSAHYVEESLAEAQPKAALYRPRADYVGRYCGPDGCVLPPLETRTDRCPCGRNEGGCKGEHEPQEMG